MVTAATEEVASIKKQKFSLIGTHNGQFHCDEALACYMLKLLPEFEHCKIVRTRDERVLDTCDIVVDVGAVYELERMRFDHHQKEFKVNYMIDMMSSFSQAVNRSHPVELLLKSLIGSLLSFRK